MVTRQRALPARDLLLGARTILAVTDDLGRHPQARALAVASARTSGAKVLLYDLEAASALSSPVPNEWGGEGAWALYRDPLGIPELERVGRRGLADQLAAAAAEGVEAGAWLPDRRGIKALLDYAVRHRADVVLVPRELVEPTLVDRLLGRSRHDVTEVERATSVPVLLVGGDGSVTHAGDEASDDR
jgi:hypothetical protein